MLAPTPNSSKLKAHRSWLAGWLAGRLADSPRYLG